MASLSDLLVFGFLVIIILFLILISWYRFRSLMAAKEQNSRINGMTLQRELIEKDLSALQKELKQHKRETTVTSTDENWVHKIDQRINDIHDNYEKIRYGRVLGKYEDMNYGDLRIILDEALQKLYRLKGQIEKEKKSILPAKVRELMGEHTCNDATPLKVIRFILDELIKLQKLNQNFHEFNTNLRVQVECLVTECSTHQVIIKELEEKTISSEKYVDENHNLERLVHDIKFENSALKEANENNCCIMNSLEEDIRKLGEGIIKVNTDIGNQAEKREKYFENYAIQLQTKCNSIESVVDYLKDYITLIENIKTSRINADEMRNKFINKLGAVRILYRDLKNIIGSNECY